MASRSSIRTRLRRLLSVDSDDPEFDSDVLNEIIQEACDSLVTDINRQNPSYNTTTVTLEADSSSSHLYTFATQDTPITDFSRWLEVRWTDSEGLELDEVGLQDLRSAGQDHFCITGIDSAPVLQTSPDSSAGTDVWLRYVQWPTALSSDNDVPGGIPLRFHDVIALEALYAFALGGEARTPRELYDRWFDRRAQLMSHVGQRGPQNSRTRLYAEAFD